MERLRHNLFIYRVIFITHLLDKLYVKSTYLKLCLVYSIFYFLFFFNCISVGIISFIPQSFVKINHLIHVNCGLYFYINHYFLCSNIQTEIKG